MTDKTTLDLQSSRRLQLCILENGLVPDSLAGDFDSYPDMVATWLGATLPEAEFHTVSAVRGEPLPNPGDYDGYILTGSRHSCYEGATWMIELIAFLRRLPDQQIPIFGICFGHQIMADAYGGKTTGAACGWKIGSELYDHPGANRLNGEVLVFHQDQVTSVPPGCKVVAGNRDCPNGALSYPFPALSVQYHPEFSREYVSALVRLYGDTVVAPGQKAETLDKLQQAAMDQQAIAAEVASFFRTHQKRGLVNTAAQT